MLRYSFIQCHKHVFQQKMGLLNGNNIEHLVISLTFTICVFGIVSMNSIIIFVLNR